MATWAERKAAAFAEERAEQEKVRQAMARGEDFYRDGWLWRKLPNSVAYCKVRREDPPPSAPPVEEDVTRTWWHAVPEYRQAATENAMPQPKPRPQPKPQPTYHVDLEPDNDAPALCS